MLTILQLAPIVEGLFIVAEYFEPEEGDRAMANLHKLSSHTFKETSL